MESKKEKNPIMIEAGRKAALTRKVNKERAIKLKKKLEKYVSNLSPRKKEIGENLLKGISEKAIVNRISKGRKNTANAQAFVTMVKNGFEKIVSKQK